jgi:hypothetical protein
MRKSVRLEAPVWGRASTFALALMCALVVPAAAQPKDKKAPAPVAKEKDKKSKGAPKEQNLDLTGIDLNGRMRTPQLLYFLERANEELERATLEKRSFIPDMVRSVEEEAL